MEICVFGDFMGIYGFLSGVICDFNDFMGNSGDLMVFR